MESTVELFAAYLPSLFKANFLRHNDKRHFGGSARTLVWYRVHLVHKEEGASATFDTYERLEDSMIPAVTV